MGTALAGITSLEGLIALATAVVLIQCVPVTSGITRVAGIGLFGFGAVLLFRSGAGVNTWVSAITKNGDILTLMLFVPLMSIPFKFPRYQFALKRVLQKIADTGNDGLYLFSHGISHLIGVIVNIACVSITYYLFKAGMENRNLNMIARSAARGYTTTCFWSPNSGAVGLVLAYWGGSMVDIMPLGIPLAILALFIGWAENKCLWTRAETEKVKSELGTACSIRGSAPYFSPDLGNTEAAAGSEPNGNARKPGDLSVLVLAVVILLVIVIILDWKTALGILVIVPLISLTYPFIWSLLVGEIKIHWGLFKEFLNQSLPKMSNEVVIFLGAGFFAVAVGNSELGKYFSEFFYGVSGVPTLLVAIILLTVVIFSLVGFHPVLTITSIVTALTPQAAGLPAPLLSVMVLASWGLAVTCSPFSACSLGLAGIMGKDPLVIGIRWQIAFTALLFLVTLVYFNFILLIFY